MSKIVSVKSDIDDQLPNFEISKLELNNFYRDPISCCPKAKALKQYCNRELTCKIYVGDFNENVASKFHFALTEFFRGYSILFISYNLGEVS